ncbi:MAG: TIGR01777 family oxidoreductase [Desulfobacca sp.]|nr:TIGR01777 family oxidoreductase [Desulfobacca sp.]
MKVFMTGGTGFVGTFLSHRLVREGHEITVLTRHPRDNAPDLPNLDYLAGDPTQEGDWMAAVADHEWVIHLAGASVIGSWNERTKKVIYDSRILSTRNVVKALAAGNRQQIFCSASAVGYYGLRGEETLTEGSTPGNDFLGRVAQAWEAEALKALDLGIRVVVTRFGLVLGRGGGMLAKLVPIFKSYAGGPVGSGRQWLSWIHQEDQVRAFLFVLEHPELFGPVNFTSPNPVRNQELAKALGQALGRPSVLPVPGFMVRLILGESAQVILEGQKVLPQRLLAAGFKFLYPTIEEALAHLLS